MIIRRRANGTEESCETRDIREGDVFRTIDDAGEGPWLFAKKDACQVPHPMGKPKMVWHVAVGLAEELLH
jgi:hypothetical protein